MNGLCTNALRRKGQGNQELVSVSSVGFEACVETHKQKYNPVSNFYLRSELTAPYATRLSAALRGIDSRPVRLCGMRVAESLMGKGNDAIGFNKRVCEGSSMTRVMSNYEGEMRARAALCMCVRRSA